MAKITLKDLKELVSAGVIQAADADRIQAWYDNQPSAGPGRLITAFGILGALLVGLGVVLVVAHNWDNLPKAIQTALAFVPMAIGQAAAAYTLLRQADSRTWREASATFWALSIGACISIISQVYQMEGELYSFLLTWLLLGAPIIYLLRSSMASLLFIVGTTWFAVTTTYDKHLFPLAYAYLPMMLFVGPHYFQLIRKQANGNFTAFHHWLIPLSFLITIGGYAGDEGRLILVAYLGLVSLLVLAGELPGWQALPAGVNGYRIVGSIASISTLLSLSFQSYWRDVRRWDQLEKPLREMPSFYLSLVFIILSLAALVWLIRNRGYQINPLAYALMVFLPAFFLSLAEEAFGYLLINGFVLGTGVVLTLHGSRQRALGTMNLGLLIVTALIICRFFDTKISFVVKGLLFVAIGLGFFFANARILRQKNNQTTENL